MSTDVQTKEITGLHVKQIDNEKRQIRVLASSKDLDRYDEIILPSAFREHLDNYMRNPVVLSAHLPRSSSGEPTIVGRTIKIWIDKTGLWAIIEFAQTDFAEEYWQLYRDGFMKAVSIGFIPIESKEERIDGKQVRIYTQVELLEISLVAVPANPFALVKSKQRKSDFVEGKRVSRFKYEKFLNEITAKAEKASREFDEQEFLAELRAENPTFDEECNEFAMALSETIGEGETTGLDIPEHDFAEIVSGKPKHKDFAALVYGKSGQ